ncbi:hypothetical protein [Roseovarius sp. D0-M9]|uniref:hypothetical protein n=1 Tax=Roseovarius sp. D0-M9 TaxID=3127117 RepID=UPI00300F7C1A
MGDWEEIFGVGVDAEDVISGFHPDPYKYKYTDQDKRLFFNSYSSLSEWEEKNKSAVFWKRPLGRGFEVELSGQVQETDEGVFQSIDRWRTKWKLILQGNVHDGIKHHLVVAPDAFADPCDEFFLTLAETKGTAGNALRDLCHFMRPDRFCQWPVHLELKDLIDISNEQKKELFSRKLVNWDDEVVVWHGLNSTLIVARDGTSIMGLRAGDGSIAIQPWVFNVDFSRVFDVQHSGGAITTETQRSLTQKGPDLSFLDIDAQKWAARMASVNAKLSIEALPPALALSRFELTPQIEERLKNYAGRVQAHLQAKVDQQDVSTQTHTHLNRIYEETTVSLTLLIEAVSIPQYAPPTLQIKPSVSFLGRSSASMSAKRFNDMVRGLQTLNRGKSDKEKELEKLATDIVSDGHLLSNLRKMCSIEHAVWSNGRKGEILYIMPSSVEVA